MKLVALAAVLAAALGPLAVVPAATAVDPAVSVDWPAATRVNPKTTAYDAPVTYTGANHLFSTFGPVDYAYEPSWATPVTDGHVRLQDWWQGTGVIQVWSCTQDRFVLGDGTCSVAATSPELLAFSRLQVWDGEGGSAFLRPGVNRHRIRYGPGSPDVPTPTATWELLDLQGNPLATPVSGTIPDAELAIDANGYADVSFTLPSTVADGRYLLDVRMAVDDPDLGHLEGRMATPDIGQALNVVVDTVAPRLTVAKFAPTIYPATDYYLDDVSLSTTSSEHAPGTFEILNASGGRVLKQDAYLWEGGTSLYWNGRNAAGQVVAEGTYTLKVSATDDAGNTGTWTGRIAVSHKRLQWVTYTRTVQAAPYLVWKSVGRCSTLARKRQGVLGFYSQTTCKNRDRSGVVGEFGIYIPKAFQNHYDWAQVTLNGGPATRSTKNYIVFGYVQPRTGKWLSRTEFHAGTGAHAAPRLDISSGNVFDRATSKPYLIWASGLTDGSRYDVRSYTTKVRYQVLK